MHKALDPHSIIVVASMMTAMMALVLLAMRQTYPPSLRPTLTLWAAAPMLWFLCTVALGSTAGGTPSQWVVMVGNTALLAGSVICHAGGRTFYGLPPHWRRWWGSGAVVMLVLAYFSWVQPRYVHRLVVMSGSLAVLYGAFAVLVARHGGRRFAARLLLVVLVVFTAILAVRCVTALLSNESVDLFQTSLMQSIYLTAYVVAALMLSICAVLAANDRLRMELETLASNDSLTLLPNRRTLLAAAADELLRAQRSGAGPALVMIDLDHFKAINDTHGHQHGDAVLLHFAQRARAALRATDTLGRFGGEEFLLLLPQTGMPGAFTVTAHVRAALNAGHALDCPFSAGVATWHGPHDTLDAMLARADGALYNAKRNGRNRTLAAAEDV